MWKKVEGRTKDVILFLYKSKGYIPKSVVAKSIGSHRVYIHKIYRVLEKNKVIVNGKLNKNNIKLKKFSIEMMKDYTGGSFVGLLVSFIIMLIFPEYSAFIMLGALTVFSIHAFITFIKLLKIEENIEVYIKCNQ